MEGRDSGSRLTSQMKSEINEIGSILLYIGHRESQTVRPAYIHFSELRD